MEVPCKVANLATAVTCASTSTSTTVVPVVAAVAATTTTYLCAFSSKVTWLSAPSFIKSMLDILIYAARQPLFSFSPTIHNPSLLSSVYHKHTCNMCCHHRHHHLLRERSYLPQGTHEQSAQAFHTYNIMSEFHEQLKSVDRMHAHT